ncbi:MAG TPA: sigma-70 family RNA polymerase sigma factor [Saprospiraceae bacterium]|mgnify:CR=1 FL=1|nr:sigma-70 family RNA polymerase sigma factor [Saprospiraceae bacterium]
MINLLNAVISGAINVNTPDEDLISEYLLTQNARLFDVLYERYSGKVYAKCVTILKDQDDAMDAMQDIFMKVLLSIASFKGNAKFSTWLYSVTYNFCIDETRRKKKLIIEGDDKLSQIGETEQYVDNIDDERLLSVKVEHMKLVLDDMRADDKSLLLMKYQDDLSIKDICDVVKKSESAVKMQLLRAKEKFIKIHEEKFHYDGQ